MFTGLVEEVGRVAAIDRDEGGLRLEISAREVLADVTTGASIAVNGCCLTVVAFTDDCWTADVVPESVSRTNLGALEIDDLVNLERPLAADGRFGGHIVQGHVDAVGTVEAIDEQADGSWRYRFSLPEQLAPYVVEKGSIAIDGISLTVAAVDPSGFEIAVIPHTHSVTNLGRRRVGDIVNLEADVLAKYVERLISSRLTEVGR
jgi:riboflavin synthase